MPVKANLTFRELMVLGSADRPAPDIITRVSETARLIRSGKTPDEAMALTEPRYEYEIREDTS